MLSHVSVGTSNQVSWGAGFGCQPPDRLEASHRGTGDEDGYASLGASLTLHRLASLSMINRETSLYPVSPPITSRAQPLACSNDSHLLAGLAKHSAQQGCSSEPPLLPNHPLLEVTALDLHFPTDRPSKTSALPPLHLFLAFCLLSLIGSEQAWCFYFVPVSAHWESWGFACHLCPPHPHPPADTCSVLIE